METSNKVNEFLFRDETPYGYLNNIEPPDKTLAHGLKKIPIQYLESREEIGMAEEEAFLLKSIKHSNILPYKENYISEDPLFLCLKTDLIGSSLSEKLKQRNGIQYDEKTVIHIFHSICEGLKYLHDHNLAHKDLRPENIYFTQTHEIKIDYIGLEKTFGLLRQRTPFVFMYPVYDAPENLQARPYTKVSNMWSLGVILYELCTLTHPFAGSTNLETDKKIFYVNFNACSTKIPPQLQEIINKLLEKDVEKRYTIDQVLNLPILSELSKNYRKNEPSDLDTVEKNNFYFLSNSGCNSRDLGLFQVRRIFWE